MDTSQNGTGAEPAEIRNATYVQSRVDRLLAGSQETLLNNVVDGLVQKELERRAELVLAGLRAAEDADNALKKINKPDVITHIPGPDGNPVRQESFSDNRMREIGKAREALQRAEQAVEMALAATPNFDKLEKLAKSGKDCKENKDDGENK